MANFKLGKEKRGFKGPILRKSLEKGVLGEANMDGSIYIDKSVKPGSALDKRIKNHEGKHVDDMLSGDLAFGDDWVKYKGVTYPRRDGKIMYNGKWSEEGSMNFPWEKAAKKAEK